MGVARAGRGRSVAVDVDPNVQKKIRKKIQNFSGGYPLGGYLPCLASDPPSEVPGWPCMKHLRGEPSDLYVPDLDLHVTYKLRGPPLRKADPGPAWQPLLRGQWTEKPQSCQCTAVTVKSSNTGSTHADLIFLAP